MTFAPAFADWERRARDSFARQGAMAHIGARLDALEPGRCAISLRFGPQLSQQHGYFHAGMTSAIADSAGGYAAYTLFPAESEVLTVEFKINLLAPARGERLVATGDVVRSGRTLTICTIVVDAYASDAVTRCALAQQTLIRVGG